MFWPLHQEQSVPTLFHRDRVSQRPVSSLFIGHAYSPFSSRKGACSSTGHRGRFHRLPRFHKTHREYLFAWPVSRRSKPGTPAGDEVRSPGRWPWLAGLARTSAAVSATLYAPTGVEVFQGSIRSGKHCNAASLAGSTRASFLHNGDKFDLSTCFEINNVSG